MCVCASVHLCLCGSVYTQTCAHISVCGSMTHIVTSKHYCLVAMADGFNKAKLQIASCISFPSLSVSPTLFLLKVIFFLTPFFLLLLLSLLFFSCCEVETGPFIFIGLNSPLPLFCFPFAFHLSAFHFCPHEKLCSCPVFLLFETPHFSQVLMPCLLFHLPIITSMSSISLSIVCCSAIFVSEMNTV